jgi:hypothetical protein
MFVIMECTNESAIVRPLIHEHVCNVDRVNMLSKPLVECTMATNTFPHPNVSIIIQFVVQLRHPGV